MDRDRPDVLGADDDGYDEFDEPAGRSVLRGVTAPEALALAALVLAGISLLGIGLLNGMTFLPPSYEQGPPERADLVAAALLGAGMALVPAALGVWALRRLPDDSPSRVTAGAAVVVAGVSVLLRLVIAMRTGTDQHRVPFVQF